MAKSWVSNCHIDTLVENWTQVKVEVLICILRNFFSTHYKHFYIISCFHNQCSYFIAYSSLHLMSHKKHMSHSKYVIRIFQMKKMKNQTIIDLKWINWILWKGFFTLVKRQLFFTKAHSNTGRLSSNLLNQTLFLKSLLEIKKYFFLSKWALLTKRPIPGRFIFLN